MKEVILDAIASMRAACSMIEMQSDSKFVAMFLKEEIERLELILEDI